MPLAGTALIGPDLHRRLRCRVSSLVRVLCQCILARRRQPLCRERTGSPVGVGDAWNTADRSQAAAAIQIGTVAAQPVRHTALWTVGELGVQVSVERRSRAAVGARVPWCAARAEPGRTGAD